MLVTQVTNLSPSVSNKTELRCHVVAFGLRDNGIEWKISKYYISKLIIFNNSNRQALERNSNCELETGDKIRLFRYTFEISRNHVMWFLEWSLKYCHYYRNSKDIFHSIMIVLIFRWLSHRKDVCNSDLISFISVYPQTSFHVPNVIVTYVSPNSAIKLSLI